MSEPFSPSRTKSVEADELIHSAMDLNQVIVPEAELMKDSIGESDPKLRMELDKFRADGMKNTDLLRRAQELLRG